MKRGEQMLDTFVRPYSAKKQNRLFVIPKIQPLLGFGRSEVGIRKGIVAGMPNNRSCFRGDAKVLAQLVLHFVGVHEDVIAKPVLNSERYPVEHRIFGVSP